MDSFLQDIRFALRALGRRPVVALSAITSLAIGIAANTAVFGAVNGVLFKRVPGVTRPERLAEIAREVNGSTTDVTFRMYRHLRDQASVLDDLAAFVLQGVAISAAVEPSVRGALIVTENYFSLLGVRAERGRVFAADEARLPSVAPVAVITHDVWQREFGGAGDIVNREARVNGTPVRIIGVLPRGFAGHHTGLLVDVFLPLGLRAPGFPDPATLTSGSQSSVELLGRLHEGVSAAQATHSLGVIADAFGRTNGESSERHPYAIAVASWGPLPTAVRAGVSAFLSVLFVLVGLALSMACMNVSTMLLAQASERQREFAVRRSLGASEGRLVRQIVTEVSVMFVAAGVIGAVAAAWATGLVTRLDLPFAIPGRLGADFSADGRVLLFSLVVTLGAALAFSLPPALRSTRFSLVPALRGGGATDTRSRSRLRSVLVGSQMAVTCVLLAGTLMFARALANMRTFDRGWNGDGVLVASIDFELNGTSAATGLVKQGQVVERLSVIPGVEAASLATKLPIGGRSSFGLVIVPGVEPPSGLPGFDAALNRVSAGYFRTMRIPLIQGRDIQASDNADAPHVAVINATMAQRLWPTADPVGRSFFIDQGQDRRLEFRVVGVARDAQQRVPGRAAENFYYVPAAQWYNSAVVLHVRAGEGLEERVTLAVRETVREVDPSLPVPVARPLNDALDVYFLPQRLAAWVSGAMGMFGLLLALLGIYGLTTFLVSRRSREMAIRSALGATNREVVRLIVLQGGRAPLIGMAVGAVLASGLTWGASRVVVGASAGDPVVVVGVPIILALAASLAMVAPVRRLLETSLSARLPED